MIVQLFFFSFVLLYYLPCLPYLLLRYCTFLRRGTLEGYVVVVVVTLLLQFIPKGCERVIYLPYLPTLVNCTNDTFLTSANFLDLVLVLLLAFLFLCLSLSLSLSLMTFRLMRPHVSS